MKRQALVLAAHGSHQNAASGDPARRHAKAIAATGRFAQVVAIFWKEFPSLREMRYLLDVDEAIIVPLFMADGYFATRVVPRELDLDGPITVRDGLTLHYTPPVGTSPRMAEVIIRRVDDAVKGLVPDDELAVVVVAHGTVQNKQSKQTALDHVARVATARGFAEVAAAYMEEPPEVADIRELVTAPNLCVVPLFVADGLHTDEDIPRDLGLSHRADGGWQVPDTVAGRRIWYTSSVGESPVMIDVILSRAEAVGEPTA